MITERQFAPNRFQHCPTISKGPPGSGTFLAYYTGRTEMHKSQHVRIHWFSDDGHEAEPIDLGDYTGNPILIETDEGTRLIYSKFEKMVAKRVEWWQYCSLWNVPLTIKWEYGAPKIHLGKHDQVIFEEDGDEEKPPEGLGYLPRCNPIRIKDGYLLPLYREHNPDYHGVILHSVDGVKWAYRGSIGKGTRCIQPTIWYDEESDKICALLRKFSKVDSRRYAYYSESKDDGVTWSELIYSPYYNANNSILIVNWKNPFVIWNNDKVGRHNISLSSFDLVKPALIACLDGYGAYPAACVSDGIIHIVYQAISNPLKTPNAKMVIRYKQYNLEAVLDTCRKNKEWLGFSSA